MTLGGMKKYAGAGAAMMLVALVLTGCSSGSAEAPSQARVAEVAESPAALEAEAPAYIDEDADETEFLRANRAGLRGMDAATDGELLAAGYDSCRQMSEGVAVGDVEVFAEANAAEIVENWNDEALAGLASQTLCTDYNVVPG